MPCYRRTFTSYLRCFWSGQSERGHSFQMICLFQWMLFACISVRTFLPSACNRMRWQPSSGKKKSGTFVKYKKEKERGKKIWSASEETPPYLRNTGGSLSSFWCFIFRGNIWIQMNRGTQVYLATVCAGFNQSQVRFVLFFLFLCSLAISLNFTSIHCALLAWMIDEPCCCSIKQ